MPDKLDADLRNPKPVWRKRAGATRNQAGATATGLAQPATGLAPGLAPPGWLTRNRAGPGIAQPATTAASRSRHLVSPQSHAATRFSLVHEYDYRWGRRVA